MTSAPTLARVSVIVPTIGRADSLRRMLDSLARQTVGVHEVVIADGSATGETAAVVASPEWQRLGIRLQRVAVQPPHAVRQREAAIAQSSGELLLFLDDDVVLEAECVAHLLAAMHDDETVVGVVSDFNNQTWPEPTRAWRAFMRHVLGMPEGAWQGRVVGPLLRFGYTIRPNTTMPMDWLTTANTLVRRAAYESVGGFSDFFLHRSTMNEDVDLGLKLSRVGRIVFNPSARLGHFHAPGGRVSPRQAAEDDLYNRFMVLRFTRNHSALAAFGLVLLFFAVETASNFAGNLIRRRRNGSGALALGRLQALGRIVWKGEPLRARS